MTEEVYEIIPDADGIAALIHMECNIVMAGTRKEEECIDTVFVDMRGNLIEVNLETSFEYTLFSWYHGFNILNMLNSKFSMYGPWAIVNPWSFRVIGDFYDGEIITTGVSRGIAPMEVEE